METAAVTTTAPAILSRKNVLRTPLVILGILAASLWFILCRHLSNEWAINEQYSYGWFVPFFAAYLFWLRWETRPEIRSQRSEIGNNQTSDLRAPISLFLLSTLAFLLLAALLPIRLFEIGNPDWRPLGWLHAGIVVALTLLLVRQIGGREWLRHFAFPICFILVAVPWISGIETPVIQGLMRAVAAVATEILNLLGVPAQLEGNLIRINSGLVGVNEACSGVRSLQTSLMIGLLFGELKRLALVRRIWLVVGAAAIAFLANCARALLLVWLAATRSPDAITHWHDVAGYSIVALVFVGTMILAALLASKVEDRKPKVENAEHAAFRISHSAFRLSTSYFLLPLLWLLLVEAGCELWYRMHERNLIAAQTWSVKWPTAAPGFRELEIDEGVRRTLRFDEGREATWSLASPNESKTDSVRAVAYFFRWNAGGSSVLRARAHRPDICLPDAGWEKIADRGQKNYLVSGVTLPLRNVSFRKGNNKAIAYTYFCLQEDRSHPEEERPDLLPFTGTQPEWSLRARTRAVRAGVRNLGQQVLEIAIFESDDATEKQVEEEITHVLQQLVRPIAAGQTS